MSSVAAEAADGGFTADDGGEVAPSAVPRIVDKANFKCGFFTNVP